MSDPELPARLEERLNSLTSKVDEIGDNVVLLLAAYHQAKGRNTIVAGLVGIVSGGVGAWLLGKMGL